MKYCETQYPCKMVSNFISTATTTAKPLYIGYYGAAEPSEQEPVNYSINKQRNEFASSSNNKKVNINRLTTNGIDENTRNRVNVKSNILLTDPMNRHNKSSDIDTGDIGPKFLSSSSNHYSGSDGSPGAIQANSQSREHSSPLTTTTALNVSTTHPRTRPSTTTSQALHGIESKSPLNVSLLRSSFGPKRTNNNSDTVSKKKSDNMGASNSGVEVSSFSGLNNNFSRPNSILVSNASVIAMKSTESIMSKSSKSGDLMGNGLTMSGLSIHRINRSIPTASITYQSTQGNRDVNRNTNPLDISPANIKNVGVNGVHLVGVKNVKSNDVNKSIVEREKINNLNNSGYIINRESIEREGRHISHCSSFSTSNNIRNSSCKKSLLWDSSLCSDNSSSGSHHKFNPVISIIPVGTTINLTTNGNTVLNNGNGVSMYECSIGGEEEDGHEQNMNPLQLTPNSVTITQLQPDNKNTAPHLHQPKLLYRASSYEEGDIVQPVMIVGPMDSVSRGVDSALYTGEQKPSFGDPVTITPVSNNFPDPLLDDPHPLNLFSTVAANQEYLPTSTINTSSTTHTIASSQCTSAKIRNINMSDLSEHGRNSDIGRLITAAASKDYSLFSEYMEYSETLSLSPPPAGMQRRPKVSYKNLTEGEKNHRLRMLNNEASRLYRHRKQRTIKNLEVEEQQLREINSKLRVEFESLQLKRNQAMKMLHESLQRCRDCNSRQTLQSGPCSHRHTNTPSKRFTVDTHTTKLVIKNQLRRENM